MYRDIVETSPDGIWLIELSGRTIYANPAMARMLGRTPQEMAGLMIQAALGEQGRRDYDAHVAHLEGGAVDTSNVDVLLHRADGSSFWALASETVLDADAGLGLPRRLLVRFAEWDERRALITREARSRASLAEAERIAGLGSWVSDDVSGELEASDGLRRLVDLPAGPLRREHLFALLHEHDRHQLDAYAAADLSAGPFSYEVRLRTPTGYRWFSGRVVRAIDPDGRATRHGTVVDIHERREAERALEDALLQNVLLQALAAAANEANTLTEGLRVCQRLILSTGDWQRARAFRPHPEGGLPVPLHVSDADRLADEADPETVRAERELAARAVAEVGIVWSESGWHGGPMVGFPISLPDEVAAVGVICSETPIERPEMIRAVLGQAGTQLARVAERDRVAGALAEARDAALEANRLKSDFLATMSHEIRTPLNGVIGLNDLLLRTALDPDQQRLTTGIQVSSRALLAILNDVLDFSKIEAGRLALEEMDFDLRAVLDQVASLLGESARARGLELVVGCDADVPSVISGDPTRLAQVLTNLGANAVKFTESGGVGIRVSRAGEADRADGAGDPAAGPAGAGEVRLHVEVTDTGLGIPLHQRAVIFDPFAQADASTTRRFGGTGLGLAICREIVAAMGGSIGVDDAPGGGSRFWFTASFRAARGDTVSAEDRLAREALGGRRVLVVDDNEHNRLILAEQVGWWGVHCTAVTSVAEATDALAAAGRDGFDLVLLDLVLPVHDGLDLAAEVQALPELGDVPLIVLSSTLPPEADRLRSAGIAGSLAKPVLASTLRALLLRYLAPEAAPAAAAVSLPPSAVLEGEPDSDRPRILVVEDNPVNQMVAAGLLDALGYEADVVDDGDTALLALESGSEGRYGAVLMDLQMPRMDGVTATRALREREGARAASGRLPVIAMTASVIRGERERCLEAGMDDFLTKPVDPRTLATVMDRWLLAPDSSASVRDDEPAPAPPAPAPAEPVDLDRLEMLRDLDDGADYLARVIDRFETNHASLLAGLADTIEAGDPDAVRASAHALKGTVTNLGLVRAGELAAELEKLGSAGVVAGVEQRMPALRTAVQEGLALLLDYRRSLVGGVAERD